MPQSSVRKIALLVECGNHIPGSGSIDVACLCHENTKSLIGLLRQGLRGVVSGSIEKVQLFDLQSSQGSLLLESDLEGIP